MLLANVPASARRLLAARAARSVGQGALVVDFALYLHALHWTAEAIGALYSASLLLGGLATLLVGPASDRYGARRFLLAYEGVQVLAAVLALLSSNPAALGVAALLGAFGRGANGGAGPFAPAEQAWLSRILAQEIWGRILPINTAIGLAGMGLGAALAALPSFFAADLPELLGYRSLFLLVLLGALTSLWLLFRANEPRPRAASAPATQAGTSAPATFRWRPLLGFGAINSLNGLGIGLIGPLMAYWLHLRFHAGPALIGPGMAIAFLVAAASSLFSIRLNRRFGMVGTVVRLRLVGLLMLLMIPLAPTFWLAMLAYILRSAMNQGSIGSRQALFLGIVDQRHRGLAATINSLSIQAPRAIGPAIAALFFAAGLLSWPFYLGAGLQALYLLLFSRFFGNSEAAAKGPDS
ncbi:MFS transporter [Acidithiobacillus sp. AMEEHan]|uniref:MFS transporter n=1 Tax=Acidithiobacillus sp. AMEEHan TaxID=2994951 RepID=UPI0027E58F42|nr:MFS transporter [Acidithiobacillus sp. AMEEHan]